MRAPECGGERAMSAVERDGDRRLARIAGAQDDVITRRQLLEAGVGARVITARVKEGWLTRLHRGVYLIGAGPPGPRAKARAAALACGGGAVLSHRSAAELWGMLPDGDGPVDVTMPARNPGARPGISLHRTNVQPIDLVEVRGLLLTRPARTLCDLAWVAERGELLRALAEARVLGLPVADSTLQDAIARAEGGRGAMALAGVLALAAAGGATRSDVERTLLGLIETAELPAPRVGARVCGFTVDFLWPRERLVVEVDGYAFHGQRGAFERDRRRDQVLIAAGYRVLRVTWRQLEHTPMAVAARIAQALAQAARAA